MTELIFPIVNSGLVTSQSSGHKRSPWDSLPSLRQDSSLNDSGYKSARADSLEQRLVPLKKYTSISSSTPSSERCRELEFGSLEFGSLINFVHITKIHFGESSSK